MRHRCAVTASLVLFVAALTAQADGAPPAPPAATRFVYELSAFELSQHMAAHPGEQLDAVVGGMVAKLQQRLGVLATVRAVGGTRFEVMATGDATALATVRGKVENCGRLEMRVVAHEDYRMDGVTFALAKERERLQQWLDGSGRAKVLADWRAIETYNDAVNSATPRRKVEGKATGEPALRWYAHCIRPRLDDATRWEAAFAHDHAGLNGVAALGPATVAVFADADWNQGRVPSAPPRDANGQPMLLEFVAINLQEVAFTGDQLDPDRVSAAKNEAGQATIDYTLQPQFHAIYGDWSQKYIRKHTTLILDGSIRAAPYFISRIPGHGQLSGDFTAAEAANLVEVLRAGELPIRPFLLRAEPVASPTSTPAATPTRK